MQAKHLNQVELSRRWGLSHRTLERWRWRGEGPAFMKLGGRVVYRLEDVLAYERDRLRGGAAGRPRTGAA
ncbi:MAG: helix-turn-helix domain-containing protein [Paracoccaceae bacterium]